MLKMNLFIQVLKLRKQYFYLFIYFLHCCWLSRKCKKCEPRLLYCQMPRFKLEISHSQWHEHHDLLPLSLNQAAHQTHKKRSSRWQNRIFLQVEFKPSRKFLIGNIILCNFIFWKHVNIWLWDPSVISKYFGTTDWVTDSPTELSHIPRLLWDQASHYTYSVFS